jgi:hypothetical protein
LGNIPGNILLPSVRGVLRFASTVNQIARRERRTLDPQIPQGFRAKYAQASQLGTWPIVTKLCLRRLHPAREIFADRQEQESIDQCC